jgi:hypothetical protein
MAGPQRQDQVMNKFALAFAIAAAAITAPTISSPRP